MKDKIFEIILNVINEMDIEDTVDKQTQLFGKHGILDSLALVNLLVEIEQEIEDHFDVLITIADEKAMSEENSPFKSLESLTDYVNKLLKSSQK